MFSVETHWINQLFAVTDICKSIFVVYTSYVLWLCMSFWPIVYFSTFCNLHKIRKSTINTTPTVVPLGTINKYRIWQLILGPILLTPKLKFPMSTFCTEQPNDMNILIRENLHKPRAIEQEGQSNLWALQLLCNYDSESRKFPLHYIMVKSKTQSLSLSSFTRYNGEDLAAQNNQHKLMKKSKFFIF